MLTYPSSRLPRLACAALVAMLLSASPTSAALTVHRGPYIDLSRVTPGYGTAGYTIFVANDAAISATQKVDPGNKDRGIWSLRWDAAGNVMEYLPPQASPLGTSWSWIMAVNATGAAVGYSWQYSPSYTPIGQSAARWDASGNPTILGHLGTKSNGATDSNALAINSSGAAVGYATKYDAQGASLGHRPVRWDPDSAAAVELGILGTPSHGRTTSQATDINDAGVAVGFAAKYNTSGYELGDYPVRWDPGSTTPVELDLPATADGGYPYAKTVRINNPGMIAALLEQSGDRRIVRWDPSGNAAELTLPANYSYGIYQSLAALNDAGVIVGNATVDGPSGAPHGTRALRWDPSTTTATELTPLSLSPGGYADTNAYAINSAGLIVGQSSEYGPSDGGGAVLWTPTNRVINLNALIAPDSGWQLRCATDISNTGWIAGYGAYDPDGRGGSPAFLNYFLLHVTYFSPGDFNLDGLLDAQDIDPFVTALADTSAYRAYLHDRMSTLAIDPGELDLILQFLDPSGDASLNVQDINPFIATLSNAGVDAQALALIPEPATLTLFLLATPLLTRRTTA